MPDLLSLSTIELLDAFASSHDPLPAGGSAAALTGAIGTSLLLMVATLPRTRRGAADETSTLAAAAARLRPLRDDLATLVERDSESYAALLTAIRAPRATEEERVRRQEGILSATQSATEVPLQTMRTAAAALRLASVVAANASHVVSGDVAAAVELLRGAVRAASHSVASNLPALKDEDYVRRVETERRQLDADSRADAERALNALRE